MKRMKREERERGSFRVEEIRKLQGEELEEKLSPHLEEEELST
jgi:hypothetical protein